MRDADTSEISECLDVVFVKVVLVADVYEWAIDIPQAIVSALEVDPRPHAERTSRTITGSVHGPAFGA
jgi:hypothetical protein